MRRPSACVCSRGGVELDRGIVDRRDQLAQRLDGVVDRVRDRARDVFGDRRLHGEVAVGEARQLVEQAQDRLLVALVLSRLRSRARRGGSSHRVVASPCQSARAARPGGERRATNASSRAVPALDGRAPTRRVGDAAARALAAAGSCAAALCGWQRLGRIDGAAHAAPRSLYSELIDGLQSWRRPAGRGLRQCRGRYPCRWKTADHLADESDFRRAAARPRLAFARRRASAAHVLLQALRHEPRNAPSGGSRRRGRRRTARSRACRARQQFRHQFARLTPGEACAATASSLADACRAPRSAGQLARAVARSRLARRRPRRAGFQPSARFDELLERAGIALQPRLAHRRRMRCATERLDGRAGAVLPALSQRHAAAARTPGGNQHRAQPDAAHRGSPSGTVSSVAVTISSSRAIRSRGFSRRLQEARGSRAAVRRLKHGPLFGAALKRAGEITLATRHRRRRVP